MDKEDEKYKKFNCKICFDLAMEPVITPCGHMYCWQCIYKWSQTKHPLKCPYCQNVFELEQLVTVFAGEEKEGKKRDIPKRPENTRNATSPPAQNQFQFGFGFGLPFMMFQLQPNQGGLVYFFIGLFLLNFVGMPSLSRLIQSLGNTSQIQAAVIMVLCFVGLHFLTKKVFNR